MSITTDITFKAQEVMPGDDLRIGLDRAVDLAVEDLMKSQGLNVVEALFALPQGPMALFIEADRTRTVAMLRSWADLIETGMMPGAPGYGYAMLKHATASNALMQSVVDTWAAVAQAQTAVKN